MPRIGATLAALALIACSIAVNVSRYPVVWEMTAPAARLPSVAQAAQHEPAEAPQRASHTATSLASASTSPEPKAGVLGHVIAKLEPSDPDCPTDRAPSCPSPRQAERAESSPREEPDKTPTPQEDGAMVVAEIAAAEPQESGRPETGPAKREKFESAAIEPEPKPAVDQEMFAYRPEPPPEEAEAAGERPTPGVRAMAGGSVGEPGTSPAAAAAPPGRDALAETDYGRGVGGAGEVAPEGRYAGSAIGPPIEEPGGFAGLPGDRAADPQRRVVPVAPPETAETALEPLARSGGEMAATVAPPFGFRSDLRRLPPVDEINPFLNDGYDPPVPDISGMQYPSTSAE